MKTSIFSRALTFLALLPGATFLSLQQPVHALPGQNLQQARQTFQTSELFRGTSLSADQYWPGSYWASKSYDGGEAVFSLYIENGASISETLQFRYPRSAVSFERDSEAGLDLISSVWGNTIAQDFVNSRYTDAIEEAGVSATNHFYLGEQYGYQIVVLPNRQTNRAIYSLTLFSHSEWEETRNTKRFCLANPTDDYCSGI